MKNLLTTALLLLFVFSLPAQAIEFYFIGKADGAGATSVTGQNELAVYLRWGTFETDLPDDLVGFRLTKNGVQITPQHATGAETLFPADAVMASGSIEQLDRESSQQQRLVNLITLLKEKALNEQRDFLPDDFAAELHYRLTNDADKYWLHFASKQNFNIARTMYQGYLDTDVLPGQVYDYRLYAVSQSNEEVQIGQLQVNTNERHHLLPVRALSQIGLDTCSTTQDHHTVTLNWEAPGDTKTNQIANGLQLVGYDIYRSAAPVSQLTERDLATEARANQHDGRGQVIFNDLVRVTEQLLLVEADGSDEPEFFQTPDTLIAQGAIVGEQYAYHIVGKDVMGHFGETASILVTIPNQMRPETPWALQSGYSTDENEGTYLAWDAVTVPNFQAQNPYYVACESPALTTQFRYADSVNACNAPRTVRLDAEDYAVYRFASATQAMNFTDSDGDGVADADETAGQTQCDPEQQPANAKNFRVTEPDITTLQIATNGQSRERLMFVDPGVAEGQAYWYRVASISPDNKTSQLTIPKRVQFPDSTPPTPPAVSAVVIVCDKGKTDKKNCSTEPLESGSVSDTPVYFNVSAEADSCIDHYESIAGQRTLVHTSCGTQTPNELSFELNEGEQACGELVAVDRSNNVSTPSEIPCVRVLQNVDLKPPQLISLLANAQSLDFEWRKPLQSVASVTFEITSSDSALQLMTFPALNLDSTDVQTASTAIESLMNSRDDWCVRGMSVGVKPANGIARTSNWSQKMCRSRRADDETNISNLGWPLVKAQPEGEPLNVLLAADFSHPEDSSNEDKLPIIIEFGRIGDFAAYCSEYQFEDALPSLFIQANCGVSGISRLRSIIRSGFIVYRQARSDSGDEGSWVQVSPFINEIAYTTSPDKSRSPLVTDSYLAIYKTQTDGDVYMGFRDRYPYIAGYDYRYQIVYINSDSSTHKHTINEWRQSEWVSPGSLFYVLD